MARTYKREIDTPRVDVLDWQLFGEVDELFRRYLPDDPDDGYIRFRAIDSRGDLEESDLASFRRSVESHHETPATVHVSVYAFGHRQKTVRLHVYWRAEPTFQGGSGGSGEFESEDEADVVYVAERCADSFQRAAQRREQRVAAEASKSRTTSGVATETIIPESGWRRFAYNPWVVTIGGGLILSGLVWLIVALTH